MDRKNFLGLAALAPLATLLGPASAKGELVSGKRTSGLLTVEGGRPHEVIIDPILGEEMQPATKCPATAPPGLCRVTIEPGDGTVVYFEGVKVEVTANHHFPAEFLRPGSFGGQFPFTPADEITIRLQGTKISLSDLRMNMWGR